MINEAHEAHDFALQFARSNLGTAHPLTQRLMHLITEIREGRDYDQGAQVGSPRRKNKQNLPLNNRRFLTGQRLKPMFGFD